MSTSVTTAQLRAIKAESAEAAAQAAAEVWRRHGFEVRQIPKTKPDQTWGQLAVRGAPDGFSTFLVVRIAESV